MQIECDTNNIAAFWLNTWPDKLIEIIFSSIFRNSKSNKDLKIDLHLEKFWNFLMLAPIWVHLLLFIINKDQQFLLFVDVLYPLVSILAEELGPALMIHFSIPLPYLNDTAKFCAYLLPSICS